MQDTKIVYFQIYNKRKDAVVSSLYNTMDAVGCLGVPDTCYLVYSEFKTNTHTVKNSIL